MSRTRVFGVLSLITSVCLGEDPNPAIGKWPVPPYWSPPPREAPSGEDNKGVAGSALGTIPTPSLPFVAVNPCRVADTRGNGFSGQAGPPSLSANVVRTFQVAGTVPGVFLQCGIPPGARAVSIQFTAVSPSSNGNLIAWPDGPAPTTSVLNWSAGSEAIGNGTVVPLSDAGTLNCQLNAAPGASVDLVLDVNGYFGGGVVTSLTPGAGLAGGGTGDVVLSIADGGVSSSQLADGAVTSAKLAPPLGLSTSIASALTAFSSAPHGGTVIAHNFSTGEGIWGNSINGAGVLGTSLTSDGVLGGAQDHSGTGAGVRGITLSDVGTGVTGQSDRGGVGVYGTSRFGKGIEGDSVFGTGVTAYSQSGFALVVNGPVKQIPKERGGWIKALVRSLNGTLGRCYNGQAAVADATESCAGFNISGSNGSYTVTFPFDVTGFPVAVTAESADITPRCCMVQYDFPATGGIRVRLWDQTGRPVDGGFSLIVF
jgi:hypothetical protein